MKIRNPQILCIGEMLWDMLPGGEKPGGAPMNVAAHLGKLDNNPLFASRIGNDEKGARLVNFLVQKGINTSLIQTDELLPTSEVLIYLNNSGNATYEICEPVAWDNLQVTEELENAARDAGCIIFGTLAARNPCSRNTILHILENSAIRILDVNFRPPYDQRETVELLLSKCDFAKFNHEELGTVSSWLSSHILSEKEQLHLVANHYHLPGICLTWGDKGAMLLLEGSFHSHPGFRVKVADTVGAGDAFLAALTDGLIRSLPPDIMLAKACATGSLVASKAGAIPDYTIGDIENLYLQ